MVTTTLTCNALVTWKKASSSAAWHSDLPPRLPVTSLRPQALSLALWLHPLLALLCRDKHFHMRGPAI